MYQFWAGCLDAGPDWHEHLAHGRVLPQMLGVLSQDQKIDQLFTALHSGKFLARPSLVGLCWKI